MKLAYLLDTGIVSAAVSKTPDAEILEHLDKQSSEYAIAAPVWHELTDGCRRPPKVGLKAATKGGGYWPSQEAAKVH